MLQWTMGPVENSNYCHTDVPNRKSVHTLPNGFQPNGFQPNGFQPNGFQSNGFQSNGCQPNGCQPNGSRTPVAWQNRDVNLSQPTNIRPHQQQRRCSAARPSQRPSSPSATTTSSDDREEVPMVRHPPRRPNSRVTGSSGHQTVDRRSIYSQASRQKRNQYGHQQVVPYMSNTMGFSEYGGISCASRALRTATLRSTKSVPALTMSTWDGEPCPIHGHGIHGHGINGHGINGHGISMPPCHSCVPSLAAQTMTIRRFGSIVDVRNARNANNMFPLLTTCSEKKPGAGYLPICCPPGSIYPQMTSPPPPPPPPPPHNNIPLHLMQPKFQNRPMIFPAFSEPLPPIRDPFSISSPVPSSQATKMATNNSDEYEGEICCKGHLVVLWIILGVVTVGVISGIILAVTMN